MPKIYITGNGIITLNEKTYYNSCEYESGFNETLKFVFCPFLYKNTNSFAYAVLAEIKDNMITEISDGAKAIIYDCDDIEIRIAPPTISNRYAPKVIAQKSLNVNGEHVLTVYDDGNLEFIIEGAFGMLNTTLPKNLKDVHLKSTDNQKRGVVLLTGKVDDKDYVCVLLVDTEYRLLYENIADNIEITAEGMKITNIYKDMLEHTEVCMVNPICTPQCLSQTFNAKWSYLNYPYELIPYLFLEALKINAKDECLSYLSEELRGDFESIKSYFGRIDEIKPPKYADYNLNRVCIIDYSKSINVAKYYDFVLSGTEIVNIEEISYSFIK